MKLGALCVLAAMCGPVAGQTVRFKTALGDIDVQLLPESAPATVRNFLNYMNKGAYDKSFIHRSVAGFIVQGGGYRFTGSVSEIPQDAPVRNEFRLSNLRGTIAMAKLGNDPNSATNQWFFNLGDNSRNLNNQNGGFTVFGRVANSASQGIVDRIAAVPVPNPPIFASPFDQLPLINYRGGQVGEQHLVMIQSIALADPPPAIGEGGVISLSSFGRYGYAAPGSLIEIYGSNLGGNASRGWTGSDFRDNAAPTSLEGVSVNIGGQQAFVAFVSPGQINVQVPAGVATDRPANVVVTAKGAESAPVALPMRPLAPGLLAPPEFKVEDRQYVAAIHSATGEFVTNGKVPNQPNAPAMPGEILVIYAIGLGPLDSSTPFAGQIVKEATKIRASIEIKIGDQTAEVLYAGLAPELVGIYQINVRVPAGLAAGDHRVVMTLSGEEVPQTLFLPVAR